MAVLPITAQVPTKNDFSAKWKGRQNLFFFSFRICDLWPLQQNETPRWPQNFIVSPTLVGKHVKFLLVRHNVVRKFNTVVKLLDSIN